MAVIVVTVVVQGMMVPAAERGTLKDWRLLVINDGIFQAIGVISFGKLLFSAQTLGVTVQC
jgi:sodium-coupled neutral amino acid transporter 11